ncbi:MAG TPA: hypothetical protein VGK47_14720 [Nitrososphaeraceae archaeon]
MPASILNLESCMMGNYHVQFGKGSHASGDRYGSWFLVHIRLELAGPGVQYIADSQLYNSIITAHAILMIFFMVNFMQNLSLFSVTKGKNYHTNVEIGKGNNQKDPLDSKYDYTKVTVEDPYYNRDIIARVAKKQKGVYV